jgi:hypothetical protein
MVYPKNTTTGMAARKNHWHLSGKKSGFPRATAPPSAHEKRGVSAPLLSPSNNRANQIMG